MRWPNRSGRLLRLVGWAGLCSLPLLSCAVHNAPPRPWVDVERFQFALWGDMPYAKHRDEAKMAALLRDMNAEPLAFTVFDGDTKDGASVCSDAAIGQRAMALFNQTVAPTIYVPGDNEWTDCHRLNNGGYDALERLSFIRQNLFNAEYSFGQRQLPLDHQGSLGGPYSENTRWIYGRVVFVGLNVPGSNNGKIDPAHCWEPAISARTPAQCEASNAEAEDRNRHNREWLIDAFRLARNNRAAGVMVVIHGDPGFDLPETEAIDERKLPAYDGYTRFLKDLESQTWSFPGPVVLVHGDTHFFKIDKPLSDPTHLLANFSRVQTFGSPNIHWLKVSVDPASRNVFHFEPMIVPGN